MKTKSVLWGIVLFVSSVVASAQSDMGAQIDKLAKALLNAKQAEVVKGSESEVYISLGQEHGVVPGNQFEVVRLGEELKLGDKVIGHEETQIATIEVEKARNGYSIAKVLESSGVPEAGDRAFESRKKVKRLAVGQFTFNQGVNRMTKSLQEKMFLSMTNQGLEVVERDQLEKVLAEQKMGYSGLVNIESAKKIGELLGAEAMVLGSISDLGNSITINARLVDLEAGNSISAAEMELAKTPLISQLLGMELKTKRVSAPAKSSLPVSTGVQAPSFDAVFQNDFLVVRPTLLITGTNGLVLNLEFQNKTAEVLYIANDRNLRTTLVGDMGYAADKLRKRIGLAGLQHQRKSKNYYTNVMPNSKTRVRIDFTSDSYELKSSVFSLNLPMLKHLGSGAQFTQFTVGIPDIRLHQAK